MCVPSKIEWISQKDGTHDHTKNNSKRLKHRTKQSSSLPHTPGGYSVTENDWNNCLYDEIYEHTKMNLWIKFELENIIGIATCLLTVYKTAISPISNLNSQAFASLTAIKVNNADWMVVNKHWKQTMTTTAGYFFRVDACKC